MADTAADKTKKDKPPKPDERPPKPDKPRPKPKPDKGRTYG